MAVEPRLGLCGGGRCAVCLRCYACGRTCDTFGRAGRVRWCEFTERVTAKSGLKKERIRSINKWNRTTSSLAGRGIQPLLIALDPSSPRRLVAKLPTSHDSRVGYVSSKTKPPAPQSSSRPRPSAAAERHRVARTGLLPLFQAPTTKPLRRQPPAPKPKATDAREIKLTDRARVE